MLNTDGHQTPSFDYQDIGRLVIVLNQIRGLTAKGGIDLANGTETTLIASASGIFHDLVHVVGSNSSDAAITISFKDATAGTVRFKMTIPAADTREVHFPHPWPQDVAGNNWTADMGDYSNTTVSLYALAIKNKK